MRRARITRPTRGAVLHHDALLGPAVHPIAQFERNHAQIITGLHGHRHFIGIRRLRVAPRLFDGDPRAAIGDRIDHVLHRARYRGAIGGNQVHVIEPALRDLETTGHRAVAIDRHRRRCAIVEAQQAASDLPRDCGVHHHGRTNNRGHITAVFHVLSRHAAIRRVVEVERHIRHRRQVVHRELERGRAHVGRLHVVLGRLRDIEQPRTETRRVGFGTHG